MSELLDDQPLGYLLARVVNALRAEVTTVLEPLGLAFPQYICLRVLSKFPGRSNAELARDMNVSPQAMNMVLRALEQRGLVTRPASVASGRSLPAELTRDRGPRKSNLRCGGLPIIWHPERLHRLKR